MKHKYALTIKKVKDPKKEFLASVYFEVVHLLQAKQPFTVLDDSLEFDSKGVLHYHGIIESDKPIYIKAMNHPGFSVFTKEIYYHRGWVNYMKKDDSSYKPGVDPVKEQAEWLERAKLSNLFV